MGEKRLNSFLHSFIYLALSLALWACAQDSTAKHVIKTCILPDDQTGTLWGRWKVTPVPIAFKANTFSSDEITLITTAADTWNQFFADSMGFPPISYQDANGGVRTSSASKPSSPCSQTILAGDHFSGSLVIYKDGTWPHTDMPNAIALTTICRNGATTTLPSFFMGIMELNYQTFFVDGKKQPDMQSIILHELGHVVGLNHSCEANKTGFPACGSADPAYVAAVMGPIFSFDDYGYGEVKRTLTDNDMGRANCLYK
jgi:hypothetical protein